MYSKKNVKVIQEKKKKKTEEFSRLQGDQRHNNWTWCDARLDPGPDACLLFFFTLKDTKGQLVKLGGLYIR